MLRRLRARLGWWSVPLEIALAVAVMHLLGMGMVAVLGEGEPQRLKAGFIVFAWLAIAVVAGVYSWSQRLKRRDAMMFTPGWRDFAPRWLRFADALADVLWAATFFTTLLVMTAGHVTQWQADLLFALAFAPVATVAQLAVPYGDPPAPAPAVQ
ncbi:hypothetical protein [Catellatospora sp. NPDC049609]|uniref:hypothetical protein n=1 Tax=Catellatospora sp. NPDC049609 TaxID=3155505 RepID=UPI00342924F5